VRDREDLLTDLAKLSSQSQYERYTLYFLASHGAEGTLSVGGSVALSELHRVDLDRRVLYMGGCSVARSRALEEFKELRASTRARAVCRFTQDVDWDESAAFELLLLNWLAYEPSRWPLEALKTVGENYAGLARHLGFVAVWKGRPVACQEGSVTWGPGCAVMATAPAGAADQPQRLVQGAGCGAIGSFRARGS